MSSPPSSDEAAKHTNKMIASYKGVLSNPRYSDEAKRNARRKLRELGVGPSDFESAGHSPKRGRATSLGKHEIGSQAEPAKMHSERVEAGYKATLNNPRAGEEAKEHAREYLQQKEHEMQIHEDRVLGGYKATLKNPKVSEEAKEHARQYLKEHGAL